MLAALLAATSTAPVTVRDIVETREVSGVSISPDEKWAAYRVGRPSIEKNRVELSWYIVPTEGRGASRRVADGGDARFDFAGGIEEDAPVWDADSRGFHFLARHDGVTAIWSWREGEVPAPAVIDDADITGFRAAEDGRALVYTVGASREAVATAEKHAYDEGVLVDARVDLMQPLAGGAVVDGVRVMQRLPGPWFERARLHSEWPIVEKRHPLARSAAAPFETAPANPGARFRKLRGQNGTTAEIRTRGASNIVTITTANGKSTDCNRGACASPRLRALAGRPKSDELLMFEASTGSEERIWRLRPGDSAPKLVATTDGSPPSVTRPPRCVIGTRFVFCAQASAIEPPRLVRIDLASGNKTTLADPNFELRARLHTRATALEWRNGDGVQFTGVLLSREDSAQRAPLVIQYYHCDGFLKGGVGDEMPMIPLTEAGVSVLCIRKADAPGGLPTDSEYDLALSGITAAIDRLAASDTVDPTRVGIGGLSFGSQVALWAVRKSKRFAAATLASGQFEPHFFWAYALPGSGIPSMLKTYWNLGDPDTDRAGWERLSAVTDIDAIDTPLLMQLPESEARLVVEFHTRLKRAGKPAELHVFADEPHIKTQPVHQDAANARNLDWFRYWLLGVEDAAPSKAAQYIRWKTYRAGQSLPAPAP